MLELNKWFFVQLINFLLLILLLNHLLFRPILRLFKERQDNVKDAFDSAKAMDKEKEELLNKINTKLHESRNQAKIILEDLKREGLNAQRELIGAAQKDVAEMTSKAQERLNTEVKKAKDALRKEVEDLSKEIVGKLVGA